MSSGHPKLHPRMKSVARHVFHRRVQINTGTIDEVIDVLSFIGSVKI
jgi:hypothetical protein